MNWELCKNGWREEGKEEEKIGDELQEEGFVDSG